MNGNFFFFFQKFSVLEKGGMNKNHFTSAEGEKRLSFSRRLHLFSLYVFNVTTQIQFKDVNKKLVRLHADVIQHMYVVVDIETVQSGKVIKIFSKKKSWNVQNVPVGP